MVSILLIDDLRDFKDERDATVARTSEEGLEALMGNVAGWDEVWFDHDLGVLDDGQVDSTMRIVDWLCEQAFNGNPTQIGVVYVHTSNPVGGTQIMRSLQNYGYNCVRVSAQEFMTVGE